MNTKGQHREREADSSTGRHRMTIGMAVGLKKGTDSRHTWVAQRFRVEQQGENLIKTSWNLDISIHMLVLVHQKLTRMCREVV